jgi:hypothetical protein
VYLPKSLACSNLTIEPIGANPTYPIAISDYLFSNSDRYKLHDGDEIVGEGPTITAGMPFFQAVYAYVKRNEDIFIAQANDYDLPPQLEKFDSKQTLKPPPAPEGYRTPTSVGVRGRSQRTGITIAALSFNTLLFMLV